MLLNRWKSYYNEKQDSLTISNLEELQDHMYHSIEKTTKINGFVFDVIKLDEVQGEFQIFDKKLKNISNHLFRFNKKYTRETASKVLQLPIDFKEIIEFKRFLANYPNLIFSIRNLEFCRSRFSTTTCVNNNITLNYLRKENKYEVNIVINLLQTFYSLQAREYLDFATNQRRSYRERVRLESAPEGVGRGGVRELMTINLQFECIRLLLFLLSLLAIYYDYDKYYMVLEDRKLEKLYKLRLIIYKNKLAELQATRRKILDKQIGFAILLSCFRSIILIFYLFSIFAGYEKQNNLLVVLKKYSYLISWLLFFNWLLKNQELKTVWKVFKVSFVQIHKSFVIFYIMSFVLVVISCVYFRFSVYFSTFYSSLQIIFCMMAGDSILDIFNDVYKYEWAGSFFLVVLLVFFSILVLTIFTTIVTDTYFTLVDEEQDIRRQMILRKAQNLKRNKEKISDSELESDIENLEDQTLLDLLEKKKNDLNDKRKEFLKQENQVFQDLKVIVNKQKKQKQHQNMFHIRLYFEFFINYLSEEIEKINRLKEII